MDRAIAIETSGRVGSIACIDRGQVVDERLFEHGLKHAAQVLPMIDAMITQRGWSAGDLQCLFLSVGPGSFTGLRIGVTLAKTLAFATGVKIVAVPTLRVLVENAPPDARHVILVLDAKRDQIFTARYERTSAGWIEREPARLDSLQAMLARGSRPVHLLGEGIPFHRTFLSADPDVIVTAEETWRARASVVAKLGLELARSGQFADPFALAPIYIRKPEALEKWELSNAPAK